MDIMFPLLNTLLALLTLALLKKTGGIRADRYLTGYWTGACVALGILGACAWAALGYAERVYWKPDTITRIASIIGAILMIEIAGIRAWLLIRHYLWTRPHTN